MTDQTVAGAPEEIRRAVDRVALLMFGALGVGLVATLAVIGWTHSWSAVFRQGFVFIWLTYAVFPVLALILNRRKRPVWAVWALVVGLFLVLLGVETRIAGMGPAQGVGLALLSGLIVAQSRLPSRPSVQIVAAGAIGGAALLMFDTFAPAPETAAGLLGEWIPVGIGGLVVGMGLFSLRRWNDFRLYSKLLLMSILVAAVSIVAVGAITGQVISPRLAAQAGASLQSLAVNKAAGLSGQLERERDLLAQLSASQLLMQAVVAWDAATPKDPAALDAQMRDLDREWKRAGPTDPVVQLVLNSPAAAELSRFRGSFQDNLQVLLLTRSGALVAATRRPQDFYYGDKVWWQKASARAAGEILISQPQPIPELDRVGVIMAAPIRDAETGELHGVIQTVYALDALSRQLALSPVGATGRSLLLFPTGQMLASGGDLYPMSGEDAASVRTLTRVKYAQIDLNGRTVLASRAPLAPAEARGSAWTDELGWSVIVEQSPDEALLPVVEAERAGLLSGVGALFLAGFLALVSARLITRPITRLTAAAEQVAAGDVTARAPVESGDEIGALARTFNRMTSQLRHSLETLEQRVADRTSELAEATEELARRAADLQTSADIARAAASWLDLAELLPRISRLIGERFGFTQVGIYLITENGEQANLHAGYAAPWLEPPEPNQSVPVGSSTFVGYVTRQGEPRVAQDVTRDPFFAPGPAPTATRAELTLPLRVAGELYGALDLHSGQVGAFDEAQRGVLFGLADQLAIAIQTARSFEQQAALARENRLSLERQTILAEESRAAAARARELAEENRRLLLRSQQAVQELNALARRLTGEAWQGYLQSRRGELLVEDAAAGADGDGALPDELERAAGSGHLITSQNGKSAVALPIVLRGEVIGSLALEDADAGRAWTADELRLIQEVSEQMALAVDNARLYSQVQQELHERRRAEEQVRGQNAYLSALADTALGLIQRLDPQALVEDILARACRLIGTAHGYVYLLDREQNELEMRIGTGVYESLKGAHLKPGEGLAGTVWQSGEPIVLDDYRRWPHRLASARRDMLRAVTGVPLKSGGQVIGVLGLAHTDDESKFDPTQIEMLTRLAQLASIALDNARLFEQAQEELVERKRAEAEIQVSLKEKEVLLKEIHHRVKNNLQVVMSLLNLESGRVADREMIQILRESQARIRSMALIHEKLYQSRDLAHIDFDGYVRNLAAYLFRTYKADASAVDLKLQVREVMLSIDRAIPCGLILNELITNSLKYAFPGGRAGEIRVELESAADGQLHMCVSDDGVGLPQGMDIDKTESLGMQLVLTLTTQLGGELQVSRVGGTSFSITFPNI